MREIKFRAWDEESKMMYPILRMDFWVSKDGEYRGIDMLVGTGEETEFEGELDLMQYTGLKDKNGKEIYEGDIVHPRQVVKFGSFEFLSGEDHYSKDIYDNGYGWYIEDSKSGDCNRLLLEVHTTHEVIGNIYENPELL